MDLLADQWSRDIAFFLAGFVLARAICRKAPEVAAPRPPQEIRDEEIDAAIRARRTIEAIKLYRQRSACGLKEARQAIQARARQLDLHR
jgi:ribosomal protein L7/L12